MLVAIPSVTAYINNSRKEAFITNAKNIVNGALIKVNSGEYDVYDVGTTYYIPATCIETETGGQSAFGGEWVNQFVVVTYNGDSFDYYYTGEDTTGMGIFLTYNLKLNKDLILTGIKNLPINVTVGDRERIIYFDSVECPNSSSETYNVRHLILDKDVYDENTVTQMFQIHGYCNFFGKNGKITGDGCADFNGQTFINTELQLFSQKNYKKDFEVSFKLERMNQSEQDPGTTQQTLIASKLERTDQDFPGFVFRFSGERHEFTQKIEGTKLIKTFAPGEIKTLKIVRKDGIVYYSINGEELVYFQDMNNFTHFFDSTLYIGAAQDGNGNPFRYINASVSNLVVRLGNINFIGIDSNLKEVFHIDGKCTFNGKDGVISGEGECAAYNGQQIIDTGLKLYSDANFEKDFMISFDIEEYDPNGQDPGTSQNTIFECKHASGKGQGLSFRKNNDKIELKQVLKEASPTKNETANKITNVKIYRKKGVLYYMYNEGTLQKLQDKGSLSETVNDTLIFGGARTTTTGYQRQVKATISNIVVKMSDK